MKAKKMGDSGSRLPEPAMLPELYPNVAKAEGTADADVMLFMRLWGIIVGR